MFTRRSILGSVSAASFVLASNSVTALAASPLSAVVTLNGQTFTYNETSGRDLGNFVSAIGGFTLRCIRCDVAGSPLTVLFRPDVNSDRAEVVFELGRVFSGTPANLRAYSVSIYRGGAFLAKVDVPAHYWFSRWRWQSSQRPIVGNVEHLIGQGLLPPYHPTSAAAPSVPAPVTSTLNCVLDLSKQKVCSTTSSTPLVATAADLLKSFVSYTVMGLAGITAYMPQTGERDDIGLVTESQAQYLITGAQAPLDCWRAQAEGAGTVPWHLRDENTNAPVNFRTYPTATMYATGSANPLIKQTTSPVTVDAAHMPALAYVPYLLTGDPYHREDLQFQANYCWGALPPGYRPSIPQSRAFAWYLRSLAQWARITPAAVPSWLLPQSYWFGFLEQHRQYLEANYVNSPNPVRAMFRSTGDIDNGRNEARAPGGTWIDPWQEEFVAAVIGWIVSMGFSNWQTTFDWKIGSTLARTGTSSGWIRAQATPYRVILRSSPRAPIVGSWAEAWALTAQVAQLKYRNRDSWVDTDMTYLTYSRGALAYANKLGNPAVTENLSWATNQLVSNGWKIPYKWRFGLGF